MADVPRDLFEAALAVRERAYVPYSRFKVGAAFRTADGAVVTAANVENAAYPQGQCAEASAVGRMVAEGYRRIAEVVVIGGEPGDGMLCTPCGGCRQRIREFAAPDVVIWVCGPEGTRRRFTLDELLPFSFGPENLGV
jgi:cytidine deaminase